MTGFCTSCHALGIHRHSILDQEKILALESSDSETGIREFRPGN
jgi:hypothetical protein